MASMADCLEAGIATGRISKEEADNLARRLDRHTEQLMLSGGFSPDAAAREAGNATLALARAEIKQQRRQRALQVVAIHKSVQNVQAHPEGVSTGVFSILGRDLTRKSTYSNVDGRGRAVSKELHRRFAEPMEALRTKNLGFTQDKKTMRNLVLELFGENTGDANARTFAKAWADTAEYARQRFNRAGGAIPKRSDWGMPQYHDPLLVKRAGREAWTEATRSRLDRQKMTGSDGLPITDGELEELLARSYDRITTNGLVDMIPGKFVGTKLANSRQDSRVLVFKTGQEWLDYADEFGRADLFTTLTGHMDGMSHDIGLLEVLGPNPHMTYRTLRDMAKKDGLEAVPLGTLDALFNVVSGKVDDTASVRLADAGGAIRNVITSARLGSAALSAVSDVAFIRQSAKWTNMSPMKVATRMLSILNPGNAADRLVAVKLGLGAEAWITRALAANRFTEVTGTGVSSRLADLTMRASGLSAWTDAGKKAFGMELGAMFGDNVGRAFNDLPELFRGELTRFGLDGPAWDVIRTTPLLEHKGAKFMSLENIMAREDIPQALRQDIATKYSEMQNELGIFAVPEPDARARALTTFGKGRGTLGGEGMRMLMQFKSFPISVILSHFYRGLYQEGVQDRAKYLASMVIGTTMFGYIAMQAKEISKGREPRPLGPETLGAAFLQGGGAGIYGDFVYASVFGSNRFGQNLGTSMAGPAFGLFASDIPRLTTGNFGEVVEGRDPHLAADMIRFMRNYTPGNSVWYTRLLTDRLIFDQLQLFADPNTRRKFRQSEARRLNEFDQEYWWRKGQTQPRAAGG